MLAAVLFTDMVDSTAIAEELGDRRWKALVDGHHRIVRRELKRFGGTELDTAGDGFFASFKEPAPAITCACAISEAVRALGVEIRAGVHFGECEQMGKKLGGITVVVGARIMALGGAGEVLVSSTAAELARGAGFGFEDRGMRTLKGVEGDWRVFAATAVDGTPRPSPFDPSDARQRRDQIAPGPTRQRRLMPIAIALAVLVAAVALPLTIRRLNRGLPGVEADAAAAIDPSNGHITAQVPLGDIPSGIAAGADSRWVTLKATDQVARIDPVAGTVTQRIAVQDSPAGVAYGADAVWVTNSDARSVSRIDPASETVVQTIEVGNAPTAIAFGEGAVWVTNTLDGTVAKIDPTTAKVETIPVGADPVGLVAGAGSIWVVNQAGGEVVRIEPSTGGVRVRPPIPVGAGPSGIAFDGTDVWVANAQAGTVMKISPSSNAVTGTVDTGGAPSQVAAGGGQIWVSDPGANALIRIDPSGGGSIAGTTDLGNAPRAITFDGETVWVTTQGSAASHQGGTLLVESSTSPRGIDPNADWDNFTYAILTNTNDGLLGFARVGGTAGSALVPDLAQAIPSPSARGTTYTFDLRQDVRYSDGSPVKPSDVLSSFERVFLVGGPTEYLGSLRGAEGCDQTACDLRAGIEPDDGSGTVTFSLTRPDPSFLSALALPGLAIVPSSTSRAPVEAAPFVPATGPYMVDSYVRQRHDGQEPGEVRLVRNPYFHEWSRAAQPAGFPEEIVIRFGLDLDRATSDVEAGRADLLLDTPDPSRREEIRTRFPAQSHPYKTPATTYLFLNTRVAPFNNRDVRRAVNFAMDRTKMADTLGAMGLAGAGGTVTCQTLPPNVPGYSPYCPYTLDRTSGGAPDMAEAQRLVDASGTKGARITVWSPTDFAATARYAASVLSHLGYRASTRVMAGGAYFARIGDSSKRAQIGVFGWILDIPEASNMFGPTLTCDSFVPKGPFNANVAEFCSPRLDRQIRDAQRLGATDPPRANELWARIDRQVVNEAPWVPFATPSGLILVSTRAGNVQYNPMLGPLVGQVWVQ